MCYIYKLHAARGDAGVLAPRAVNKTFALDSHLRHPPAVIRKQK